MPIIDWQDGPGGGTPLSAANLDRMVANLSSFTLPDIGTPTVGATGGALTISPDFMAGGTQRVALSQRIYAGGNAAIIAPLNVATMEAWYTLHFFHLGAARSLGYGLFGGRVSEGGQTILTSTTGGGVYDLVEHYTMDGGTTWVVSIVKDIKAF